MAEHLESARPGARRLAVLARLAAVTLICIFGPLLALLPPAQAQFAQQGPKLLGEDAFGAALQGSSVALSADGNIAIVGGSGDDAFAGAAWVFTRANGAWKERPVKLVGAGADGHAREGSSVAISADGATAVVGGSDDDSGAGAAWIFTRSGDGWTQQGMKLVGEGAVGKSRQGKSVALSGDGNTAIVGGDRDDSGIGAAWVFTRENGAWRQQGPKLVGTGFVRASAQGWSVALSADGNTAIVGGFYDDAGVGAAWIFTRRDGEWTQQGEKLVGFGAVRNARQGSVALSADGNTALMGGWSDDAIGAAWVFARAGGIWRQQGSKLVGADAIGAPAQGWSVALSGDGNTAALGGEWDNSRSGAAWVFTRKNATWKQRGSKLVGGGAVGSAGQGHSIALSSDGNTMLLGGWQDAGYGGAAWAFARLKNATGDFDGDGFSDILWRNNSGDVTMWLIDGMQIASGAPFGKIPSDWRIVGTGDFNGDKKSDVAWLNSSGDFAIWLLDGGQILQSEQLENVSGWTPAAIGDFNGDGKADILWRNSAGDLAIWCMNGFEVVSALSLGNVDPDWEVAGVGDFDGNGTADIVWRHSDGAVAVWLMNDGAISSSSNLGTVDRAWTISGIGDFNGDGRADILWRHSAGDAAIWFMNGSKLSSDASLGSISADWSIAKTGDFDGDGKSDILWRNMDVAPNTGEDVFIWMMDGASVRSRSGLGYVGAAWAVQ